MAKSNDATLLSRRRMLSQSSMVLAMSALPATALAVTSASHPDARLLALGAELDALAPRLKAAFDRCAETHDAYRAICPPYPDVLRVTTEDAKMGLPKPWGHRDGRFYTPGDLCDLRNHSTCR